MEEASEQNSISVIIPAYNEEATLDRVTRDVIRALRETGHSDFEILIFDDKSRDRTPEIADRLAAEEPRVRAIHNERNMNLGYNFRTGVATAAKKYVMMIPADGDIEPESFKMIFAAVGRTDLVLVYAGNREIRPRFRQAVSALFTGTLNLLFGLRLKYYNGTNVFRTELARRVLPKSTGFAYMAEMVVPLVRAGASYVEVPMVLTPSVANEMVTSAFRFKNVRSVVLAVLALFISLRLLGRNPAKKTAKVLDS